MFEGIVKFIIVVAAVIVFVASFREEWKKLREENQD